MPYCLEPLINSDSKILILGTLPGRKSLEIEKYYADTRNKFWDILSNIFDKQDDCNYSERYKLLSDNNIALWDTLSCAERDGAADHTIRNAIPNDFVEFLKQYPNIRYICFNGEKAEKYFMRYNYKLNDKYDYKRLPSTSGALPMLLVDKKRIWKEAIESILMKT